MTAGMTGETAIPTGANPAGFFCCPGSVAYGILEAEIPVVEKERFTTFLLLLAASICRVIRNLNRRDCPSGSSLVSVEQASDEISATGGHRLLARYCRVMSFILGDAGQK